LAEVGQFKCYNSVVAWLHKRSGCNAQSFTCPSGAGSDRSR
jgi:hypothetical protein